MLTKEIIYKRAFEEQKTALKKREQEYEILLSSLYVSNPRLKEIDNELSAVGARLAITALSGDKKKIAELKSLTSSLSKEKKLIIKNSGIKKPRYKCSACEDTGYVGGKICDCIKNNAKAIMLSELSRDLPLDRCSFEDFDLKYYQNVEKI